MQLEVPQRGYETRMPKEILEDHGVDIAVRQPGREAVSQPMDICVVQIQPLAPCC